MADVCGKYGSMIVTADHPNGDPEYACALPPNHDSPLAVDRAEWHEDKYGNKFKLSTKTGS